MEQYRTRVRLFYGIILVVLGVLGLRLAQLQLLNTEVYTGESRSNAVRARVLQPARGAIFDRNHVLMVDNEPSYTILLTPRYFDRSRVGLLADLLEAPDSTVAARLQEARDFSVFQPSPAFREVPFDVFSRVQENLYRLPGVSYRTEQRRRYQTGAQASHALGYIREISGRELAQKREAGYRMGDLVGQTGIEKRYEPYLRGVPGSAFKLVNVHGLEVKSYRNGVEDTPPIGGYDMVLGIDARVQALAESLFVGKRGGAVAIDPKTGEIISFVSAPDYDPELFTESVDARTWGYLMESDDKPMLNRATMSVFPPGSTWKPFMALMALQEDLIEPGETYFCPGYHPLGGGRFFRCMHVHGAVDVVHAIQHSCNTFFFEMMLRANVEMFNHYAHLFGFGEKAPTDLLEQDAGIIPDSAYFDRIAPKGWGPGWTLSLGIGQGNMGVTPLQLARFMAAVANRGTLPPPHLVRELVHPNTGEVIRPDLPAPRRIPIEASHFDLVREGMKLVMEAGTGYWVQIPGIPSGGKTGTAQNPHGKDHSVFVLFAPYDDPEIAIAVFVENGGYGATAAGPIASLMAELYLTGEIADTPQRQALVRRVLNVRSADVASASTAAE